MTIYGQQKPVNYKFLVVETGQFLPFAISTYDSFSRMIGPFPHLFRIVKLS